MTSQESQASHGLFSTFIMGLSHAALVELGEVEDPITKKMKSLNINAARSHIDLLIMFRDKTQGNLSDEETTLLGQVIKDLQLAYAAKSEAKK